MFEKIINLIKQKDLAEMKQLLSILDITQFASNFNQSTALLDAKKHTLPENLSAVLNTAFLLHQQAIEFCQKESWNEASASYQHALSSYQKYIDFTESNTNSPVIDSKNELYFTVIRNSILAEVSSGVISTLFEAQKDEQEKVNAIECFHRALKIYSVVVSDENQHSKPYIVDSGIVHVALGFAAAKIAYAYQLKNQKKDAIKLYLEAQQFYQHASTKLSEKNPEGSQTFRENYHLA